MAIILCITERGANGNKTCPKLGDCPEQEKYGCPVEQVSEKVKLKQEITRLQTILKMKEEGTPVEVETLPKAPTAKPVVETLTETERELYGVKKPKVATGKPTVDKPKPKPKAK